MFTFAHRTIKQNNMANNNVILQVPTSDMAMITMLAKKMGWAIQSSDTILKQFIESRPSNVPISEDDIMEEVRAIRYQI